MTKFLRLLAGLLCLSMIAMSTVVFERTCPFLSPFQGYPAKSTSMADVLGRKERLEERKDALRHLRLAKEQVAAEVITRWRTLAAAIEEFRILDQKSLRRPWPAAQMPGGFEISEDEWDGRNVLSVVQQILLDRPDEAAAVVGRLEKELQQLLANRKKHRPAPVNPRTEERGR